MRLVASLTALTGAGVVALAVWHARRATREVRNLDVVSRVLCHEIERLEASLKTSQADVAAAKHASALALVENQKLLASERVRFQEAQEKQMQLLQNERARLDEARTHHEERVRQIEMRRAAAVEERATQQQSLEALQSKLDALRRHNAQTSQQGTEHDAPERDDSVSATAQADRERRREVAALNSARRRAKAAERQSLAAKLDAHLAATGPP